MNIYKYNDSIFKSSFWNFNNIFCLFYVNYLNTYDPYTVQSIKGSPIYLSNNIKHLRVQ